MIVFFKKIKKQQQLFGSFLGKTEFFSKFCSYQLFLFLTRYNGATFKKKLTIRFQAKSVLNLKSHVINNLNIAEFQIFEV